MSALTAEQIVERLPSWNIGVSCASPAVASIVGQGLTNTTFLVRCRDRRLVVRVNAPDSDRLGIDRRAEQKAARVAERIGLGPRMLYCDLAEGIQVSEYLPGAPLSIHTDNAAEIIPVFAAALKRLHGESADLPVLDPRVRASTLLAGLEETRSRHLARVADWDRKMTAVWASHQAAADANSFCHNDLVPNNVLLVRGTIRIVDWEYASMGDAFFDLASVVEEFGLDARGSGLLLSAYGASGPRARHRMASARVIYRFLCLLWHCVRDTGRDPASPKVSEAIAVNEEALRAAFCSRGLESEKF